MRRLESPTKLPLTLDYNRVSRFPRAPLPYKNAQFTCGDTQFGNSSQLVLASRDNLTILNLLTVLYLV